MSRVFTRHEILRKAVKKNREEALSRALTELRLRIEKRGLHAGIGYAQDKYYEAYKTTEWVRDPVDTWVADRIVAIVFDQTQRDEDVEIRIKGTEMLLRISRHQPLE